MPISRPMIRMARGMCPNCKGWCHWTAYFVPHEPWGQFGNLAFQLGSERHQ